MNRYAVIMFIHRPSYRTHLTETVVLEQAGAFWVSPDGKLKLRHLGLQRIDGENGRVVEANVNEPRLRSTSDYFVFVGSTENEADNFAAGALAMRAACEVQTFRFFTGQAFSDN